MVEDPGMVSVNKLQLPVFSLTPQRTITGLCAGLSTSLTSTGLVAALFTLTAAPEAIASVGIPLIVTAGVPLIVALTLPVTGSGVLVTSTGTAGVGGAATTGWRGTNEKTMAKNPKITVKKMTLLKCVMLFLL
jgi:hypothetical protein